MWGKPFKIQPVFVKSYYIFSVAQFYFFCWKIYFIDIFCQCQESNIRKKRLLSWKCLYYSESVFEILFLKGDYTLPFLLWHAWLLAPNRKKCQSISRNFFNNNSWFFLKKKTKWRRVKFFAHTKKNLLLHFKGLGFAYFSIMEMNL